MFAVVQNGEVRQILQLDVPFSVGDKQYSSSFLRTSSSQEKIEAGVWEIIEGQRPDDRYYWVSGPAYRVVEANSTVEASYSGTAKDLTELKASTVAQVKSQANSMLQPTDWLELRKLTRNVDVPADVVTYRQGVIDECNRLQTAIGAATDVEGLISALGTQNWPK
jgi:hypothetical protein